MLAWCSATQKHSLKLLLLLPLLQLLLLLLLLLLCSPYHRGEQRILVQLWAHKQGLRVGSRRKMPSTAEPVAAPGERERESKGVREGARVVSISCAHVLPKQAPKLGHTNEMKTLVHPQEWGNMDGNRVAEEGQPHLHQAQLVGVWGGGDEK
jgi:hypothetical protein